MTEVKYLNWVTSMSTRVDSKGNREHDLDLILNGESIIIKMNSKGHDVLLSMFAEMPETIKHLTDKAHATGETKQAIITPKTEEEGAPP